RMDARVRPGIDCLQPVTLFLGPTIHSVLHHTRHCHDLFRILDTISTTSWTVVSKIGLNRLSSLFNQNPQTETKAPETTAPRPTQSPIIKIHVLQLPLLEWM